VSYDRLVDWDLPVEHVLRTGLSVAQCREELADALGHAWEQAPRGHSARVTGEVTDGGFSLTQHVLASPLNAPRTADGEFIDTPAGTRVSFRLALHDYPFTGRRPEREALHVVRTLLSATWQEFERAEAEFFRDFLAGALEAADDDRAHVALVHVHGVALPEQLEPVEIVGATIGSTDTDAFADALDEALSDDDASDAEVNDAAPTAAYGVVIEPFDEGYAAYVPDLPGCGAIGETLEAAQSNIVDELIAFLDDLLERGEDISEPLTVLRLVEVRTVAE
jgi:predicted RNase H-like HicB family nuclease